MADLRRDPAGAAAAPDQAAQTRRTDRRDRRLNDRPVLAVRVIPRSAKPGVGGWREDAEGRKWLEVRVAAAPADGAANDETIKLLAAALGVTRSDLHLKSGAASRNKIFLISLSSRALMDRLNANS
ncbi:MAG: DUF167 domain-containing protein [Sphingomonas bacterium]|nr:DUF167 domain-containing protein [Sphingomonas bacterium]